MCICGIWCSKHNSDTPTAEGSADFEKIIILARISTCRGLLGLEIFPKHRPADMGFWLIYGSMGRFTCTRFSWGSMCFFFWGSFLALSLGFCKEIAKRDRCGCSLAHGCSPKHCFYRAKWTSKIRPPKVCSFIVKIVCVVRKSLKNPSNITIIALGKAFLSFSLRFCSTFKKHCKSLL